MSRYDFTTQRLFVDSPLIKGGEVEASSNQTHYLLNVLRMKLGDKLLLFNGVDGEWLSEVSIATRKVCVLQPLEQTRAQPKQVELVLAFAPIKSARLDYMVQKAVEMGVSKLIPVITRRTQVTRLNLDRMRANVIEAAEQCGILSIAKVEEDIKLERFLQEWQENEKRSENEDSVLIFCDEDAQIANPITAIQQFEQKSAYVLIGPEGGFDEAERCIIKAMPNSVGISLGPRILRADTAAIAALTAVQCAIGDWC
jgi:16S rRNA (uracil1498-N3)-methyltransferase